MKKIMFVMTILAAFTSICAQTAVFPSSGNGTPEDPFQISTWQNLYWLSQANGYWKSSYHFIQTADIDFADANPAINTWNYGRGWSPIGGITMFTGTYDGNGHTISNLYAYDAESYILGLFGETNQTTIKNLGLISPYFRGEEPVIGSFVAIGSFTTISNCYVRGGSLINQFYLNGGIAGVLFDWSSITDSYAQCTFTGPAMHGGIIGAHYPNCSMIRCYSASVFPVSGSNRGALASQVYGGLIQDNRWDASKAGSIGAIGNQSGSPVLINNAGLSTSDMKNPVNYPASWDFEDVWGCYHAYNDGYPYLRWEDPPIPDFPQDSFTEVEEGISIKPLSISAILKTNSTRTFRCFRAVVLFHCSI